MKRSFMQDGRRQGCELLQQDHRGPGIYCRLLEFSELSCVIVTRHGCIKWATTSGRKLLQRYWPARTGVENRLPSQIHQWMATCRTQRGAKDKSSTELPSLSINRSSAYLTVRYMPNGTCSALLFEEILSELPADRLVSHGLTPRETEVLRWLIQGKSSFEIATILTISVRTVSKHLERIYLRLGVENRHGAVSMVHDELRRTAPR